MLLLLLLLNLFNGFGFFSRTIWGFGIQWHQLDHMQTICTSLETDNHTNTSSLNFYTPDALPDAQRCQSTEGKLQLKLHLREAT